MIKRKDLFRIVYIFGKECLFTNRKISRDQIPKSLFVYEVKTHKRIRSFITSIVNREPDYKSNSPIIISKERIIKSKNKNISIELQNNIDNISYSRSYTTIWSYIGN